MYRDNAAIDYSDIPEITDFSKARKNPYAEKIRKHGYSITIRYSPEDVAKMDECSIERIDNMERMDWMGLENEEIEAMKKYREGIKLQGGFPQEGN